MEYLKPNNIYNMDCLDGLPMIKSSSVRLIVADAPYFQGLTHNGQQGSFVDLSVCKPFFKMLFAEYKRVLRPDGEVYFFCDWRGYAFYFPLFNTCLGARNCIVWDKENGAGTFYQFQHEFILFHSVDNHVIKRQGNVWRSRGFSAGARATNGEKIHPTQKTLEIVRKIVTENSNEGDLVLDTFGGSGTTAVVCQESGRDFILFELDEEHFENSMRRRAKGVQGGMFNDRRDEA